MPGEAVATWPSTSPYPRPLRVAIASLILVILSAATAVPASAEPKPTAKELRSQLNKLQKEYDAIVAAYNANRVALAESRRAEAAAKARLDAADGAYNAVRSRVAEMAQLRYQSPPLFMTLPLQGGKDPHAPTHAAAVLQAKQSEQAEVLKQFAAARDERRRAEEEAAYKRRDLQGRGDKLRDDSRAAEDLIAKIKDKIDKLVVAPGARRPDGSRLPQLPGGPDNITPRTRLVRDLVKERFGLPNGIGCYRSLQDGGEHPQGRACDFMITAGGTWPSPARAVVGDQLAAWAIKNARRLGIKYVIYRKRIWQGGGWRVMSDRGGITANHQDHVHISMH